MHDTSTSRTSVRTRCGTLANHHTQLAKQNVVEDRRVRATHIDGGPGTSEYWDSNNALARYVLGGTPHVCNVVRGETNADTVVINVGISNNMPTPNGPGRESRHGGTCKETSTLQFQAEHSPLACSGHHTGARRRHRRILQTVQELSWLRSAHPPVWHNTNRMARN